MASKPVHMPNETRPITFIRSAVAALNAETEASGLHATDVANRSVQVYHFIMEKVREGKEIQLVGKDGSVERVHIS